MNQSKQAMNQILSPVKQITTCITTVFAKMLTFIQRFKVKEFAIKFKLFSTSQNNATF